MVAAGKATTIAIVGAGPGGLRLAAHLGMAGHRLRLNDLDDSKLALVRERGGLDVGQLDGSPWGFARIELATTHLEPTVAGAPEIHLFHGLRDSR